jgi:hypothetical protein
MHEKLSSQMLDGELQMFTIIVYQTKPTKATKICRSCTENYGV